MLVLWQLLWSNVLVAAVLAVLATGLSALFRRPALTHGLWLLVLLKLVTPPLVPVTVVLPAAAAAPEERVAPLPEPEIEPEPAAEKEEEEGILGPLEMFGLPDAPRPRPARPAAAPANPDRQDFAPAEEPAPPVDDHAGQRDDAGFPWIPVLVSAWLMTSLAWFAVAGVRVRRFQRLLRHARVADPALQRQVAELSRARPRRGPGTATAGGRAVPPPGAAAAAADLAGGGVRLAAGVDGGRPGPALVAGGPDGPADPGTARHAAAARAGAPAPRRPVGALAGGGGDRAVLVAAAGVVGPARAAPGRGRVL